MRFFYYCFYRIGRAYKSKDKDFQIYAQNIVSMCQGANILTLISIMYRIQGYKMPKWMIIVVLVPFLVANLFILNRKKYYELDERWKNENYQKLKGWLVLFYILSSLALCFWAF